MKCFYLFLVCFLPFHTSAHLNVTTRKTLQEDYYINYDYELSSNNNDSISSDHFELKSDSLILPNPETIESRYNNMMDHDRMNVELPDDSLADTDLKDHDFIDNLMYVYYGSHNRSGNNYGPEIIIIGSVLSCAAQLLTIFCVLLQKNLHGKKEVKQLFLHLMACLCLSNLVFMLGVYATKNTIKCTIIAFILEYLNLIIALWIFLYCYYIFECISGVFIPKMRYLYLIAYGSPALLAMMTFGASPNSYETRRFCFVSVQKGMFMNYMLPISILIIMTMVFSLNGIRKLNLELSKLEMNSSAESLNMLKNDYEDKRIDIVNEEVGSLKDRKNCLIVLCVTQTSYDVVWFTAVLALENVNYSISMPIFYTITSLILNWYIFAKTKSFLPTIVNGVESGVNVELANMDEEKGNVGQLISMSRRSSSDNIPLLMNSEVCTEMHELHQDRIISTIST